MGNLERLIPAAFWQPSIPTTPMPAERQLATAMANAGIKAPSVLHLDGIIHRFSTSERKDDDAGWYVAYGDGIPSGAFGNWREGTTINWRADIGRPLSAQEEVEIERRLAEMRRIREEEREERALSAARRAQDLWDKAKAATEHPYLTRKNVGAHGSRISANGTLLLPLFDGNGNLSSLEFINADGEKKFLSGGVVKGCCWWIGQPSRIIYLAEGFSTAASIHEATGDRVYIAYSAGNLTPVAQLIRGLFPQCNMVIVADNDESGTGIKAAREAAAIVGAEIIMPPTIGMDANDWANAGEDLQALLEPPSKRWLISGDSWLGQPAPLTWLVKRWVQDQALVMIHGPSGSGKTFIALDWMLRMSSGLPDWFGAKVKSTQVVYLCGEGHHGLRSRIAAWAQYNQVQSVGDILISRGALDFDTPSGYQQVVDSLHANGAAPRLILIDTLNRFQSGDENSAQDTRVFLSYCERLMQDFSCTVLIVHHTGLNDDAKYRARGSSAWKGALDNEISVEKGKDGTITVRQVKVKDAEPLPPLYLELEPVQIAGWVDEDGEPVTSAVLSKGKEPTRTMTKKEAADVTALRAAFTEGGRIVNGVPYITRDAWQAYMVGQGMSQSTARQAFKEDGKSRLVSRLIEGGVIERDDFGYMVVDQALASTLMLLGSRQAPSEGEDDGTTPDLFED